MFVMNNKTRVLVDKQVSYNFKKKKKGKKVDYFKRKIEMF